MDSRTDRALSVTRDALALALVPIVATVLSLDQLQRALAAGPGFGIAFPFPTGLPTLWTYVSLPGVVGVGEPGAFAPSIALVLVGLLVTSALEAGFLGTLDDHVAGRSPDFLGNVSTYLLQMLVVNVLRILVVLLALPFLVFGPLALAVIITLNYLIYGLPFAVVVGNRSALGALSESIDQALSGGLYASFGFAHLFVGALASVLLTLAVRNLGLLGVLLATALVAIPAVFVATYGLLVFADIDAQSKSDAEQVV